MLTLIAACKDWVCWSQSCGFIVMGICYLQVATRYQYLSALLAELNHGIFLLQPAPKFCFLQHFFFFYLSGMCSIVGNFYDL